MVIFKHFVYAHSLLYKFDPLNPVLKKGFRGVLLFYLSIFSLYLFAPSIPIIIISLIYSAPDKIIYLLIETLPIYAKLWLLNGSLVSSIFYIFFLVLSYLKKYLSKTNTLEINKKYHLSLMYVSIMIVNIFIVFSFLSLLINLL